MTMDWLRFPEVAIRRGIERLAIPLALIVATTAFSQNPTASSYLPPDGSSKISGRQPFQIQFGSAVQAGSGNIVFRRSSDNSIFESIPVNSDRVSFGSSLLLNGFESNVEEWGVWGAAIRSQDNSRAHSGTGSLRAVTNQAWIQVEGRFGSQNWSGFDSLVCWVYTEISGANAHVFTRSGPTDAWTDAMALPGPALTQNAWTRISIPMTVVADPSRVNSYGLNFSLAGTYWVDDVALLRSNSSLVSFLPSSAFALGTGYHINIDAGAIKNLSSENYAGISDAATWNFTTNFQPEDISLNSNVVAENLAPRSFVGRISATDPDVGESFLFQLASGTGSTDNASFAISNDSLFTNAVFDFETKSSYSIRIRAEDRRTGLYSKEFSISVADASERLTWDNASTPGIQTGSGTWGTDNFWSYNGTDLFAWPGSGHAALFAGADGSYPITVNGTQNADSVIFSNAGYALNSGTIAMTGSSPTIVANADATISSTISGAFSKAGAATLTLAGNNSAAQPYTHFAGTVVAATSTALGSGTVNMNGTGRIVLNNGVNLANTLTISACSPDQGRGALESNANANATWSGTLNVNADCANGGVVAGATDMTGSLTITGPINMGGTATSVKQRAGMVVYSGGGNATRFDLQRGTAKLGANNGLPPYAALIQSESNTSYQVVVDLNGFNQQLLSLYSLIGSSRSVTNSHGAPSTLTLTGSSDTTYLGDITGKIALEKTGTGRQTLKGANTYFGSTSVRGGTLVVDGSLTSTSPVDVTTGGKLFCSGSIPGSISVNEGSLQPGTPTSLGVLNSASANFSNGTGSSLNIRVRGLTTAGTDFDRLNLSGSLTLGGASVLNIDLAGMSGSGTITGFVQASSGVSGKFANVNVSNAGSSSVMLVYNSASLDLVVLAGGAKLTWDTNTSSGIQPGSGTWGTNDYWTTDGSRLFAWPGSSHIAEFAGSDAPTNGSHKITISGSRSVDSLVFLNSGYVLDTGMLTLARGIRVASGKSDTINRTVVAGPGITLDGGGTLVVRNTQKQQFGFLNIANGTFIASRTSGSSVGNKLGTGIVTVAEGATLILDSLLQGDTIDNVIRLSGSGTGEGALQFRNNHNGARLKGKIVLQGNTRIGNRRVLRIGSNDHVGIDDSIIGPYNLTFSSYKGYFRSTGVIAIGGDVILDQTDTFAIYSDKNSYSGNTRVEAGILRLLGSNAIPNGASRGDVIVSGMLDMFGASDTINGLEGSGIVDNFASTVSTLFVGGNDRTSVFSGAIKSTTGALGLTKIGSGILTLSGTNTYSGPTAVNVGTLNVTGSLAASSAVNVSSGATLSGTGTVSGALTVGGGTVQPGTAGSIGILNGSSADLSTGSTSSLNIRMNGTTKPGIEYDRLILSGAIVLGGNSVLNLDLSGLTETGTSTGIVQAGSIVGTFATVNILNYAGNASVTVVYKSTSIDVVVVNAAPSFAKGANQTVPEDAGLQTTNAWATSISKGSTLESGQNIGFRVSNDNNALFSAQPAVSANGTLTYTPAANANGIATISVKLGDDGGTANGGIDSSATQTFTVAVTAVNDAPGFAKGSDQNVLQNTSSQTIANWATSISSGPANESGQNVGFRVSNDNNVLFSVQPAVSTSGTLTYTPAANATGIATIFVKLGDDGGTANGGIDSSLVDSFTIGVGAVNQPPSFTKGTDQSVQEDAGAQTTPWATAISKGPSNESGQSIGFRVSNDDNALFSAQPAISASGTLSYTPAANANGIATISVRLGDNGGTANGGIDSGSATTFTITVAAVNDGPSFAKGANPSVSRNSPTQTIANWATSISSGPANESDQNVGFRVTNDDNSLFSVQPSVSSNGTLTFAPAENAIGNATISVRLGDDGGTANGGIDSSAEASFTIRISPPLNFTLRPDTLRMRPGDTATFSIAAKNGAGDDTTVAATELTWSWTPDLGILEAGHVTSLASGSAMVGAFGFGTGDSAWLVVSPLDTVLAPGPDSVVIRVGHGVIAMIPPPTTPRRVAIVVVDSIMGSGIAGADTAVKLVGGTTGLDSIRLEIPSALVPAPLRSQYGTPSVYWKDPAGVVHESPARLLPNSSLSIHAVDGRTYWLGYDTLAPVVATTLSGDSIRSGRSIRIDWRLFDNVAETGSYLCLLKAGSATAACSLLVRGDSIHGTVLLAKAQLPLGGRVWMEARDARTVVRNGQRDVVVQLDTLRATAPRTEDRYELVAFPYTSGAGSAHAAFQRQWGPDNPKRWRAFSIDSTDFVEVLDGGRQDAWGCGFWVRTRKANLTSWIFGGWTPPVSDPVQVELDPGWNMVGNPLGFDVSWRQVRKLSGLDTLAISGPYRFDGSNQSWTLPDTTMSWPAWHGVAVHNSTGHALRLLIPSIPTGEFASRSAHTDPLLRFSVRGSQASDTTARIWGGFDIPASSPLPPSPIALRVFLPPPVGSNTPIPYFTDVRSYANEGSTWTIHVDGLYRQVPLVLDLARSGTDTAIPLWIRDDKSGRWLPFASRMDFAVGDETRRDFQLLAGAAPVNPNTSRRFGLHNRGRDLGWSLPDEMGRTRVKIDVFDLRGRKLLGFVDEEMDPGTYARDFELAAPTTQLIVVLSANGRREILRRLWVR